MARTKIPVERRILCTTCARPLDISGAAKSVSCKHCNARVVTEAMTIKEYMAVRRVSLANKVHITRKGLVYASVHAEDIVVEGQLQGDLFALHNIHVGKKAQIKGDLRASWLSVDEGATIEGHMRIGPDEVPELEGLRRIAEPESP